MRFIKAYILYHAPREPVYDVWLMDDLDRPDCSLSPGTLCPVLHSLEEQGYLKSHREVIEGRIRRYHVISREGEKR